MKKRSSKQQPKRKPNESETNFMIPEDLRDNFKEIPEGLQEKERGGDLGIGIATETGVALKWME